jgi:integrase
VKPHDLRRSYARRMYEAGADIVAIQQNLGHSSIETTMTYIGELDARRRRGRNIYNFDVGDL